MRQSKAAQYNRQFFSPDPNNVALIPTLKLSQNSESTVTTYELLENSLCSVYKKSDLYLCLNCSNCIIARDIKHYRL